MSLLFLIGMPLSGKSYWAKQLSKEHAIPFVDTDTMIEERVGKKIRNIFQSEGEDVFRKYEYETLLGVIEAYKNKPLIVACGGGTPVFHNGISVMKNAGCVVYLKADVLTLAQRLDTIEERDDRPVLHDMVDLEEEMQELLDKRRQVYEQADYTVTVPVSSITIFEPIILSCIQKH
jgi:shikimate kinase